MKFLWNVGFQTHLPPCHFLIRFNIIKFLIRDLLKLGNETSMDLSPAHTSFQKLTWTPSPTIKPPSTSILPIFISHLCCSFTKLPPCSLGAVTLSFDFDCLLLESPYWFLGIRITGMVSYLICMHWLAHRDAILSNEATSLFFPHSLFIYEDMGYVFCEAHHTKCLKLTRAFWLLVTWLKHTTSWLCIMFHHVI